MMKKLFCRIKNKNGFTLLEMIVAMTLFLITSGIVAAYIIRGYQANTFTVEFSDTIRFAKRGIGMMEKEIRESVYAQNGDYPIVEALDQSFTFYSDADSDNAIEKIRYYLNGTNLMRSITEPTQTLPITYPAANEAISTVTQYIQNTSTPVFYYYNEDYPADTANNPLTTPADVNNIKLVRLYLKVNISPLKVPHNFILETFVQLRNLKNNL